MSRELTPIPVLLLVCVSLAAAGCSAFSTKKQPIVYAAGEKATVGRLIYNVTDAQTAQQLGDDPNTARVAQQRFYVIKVSVSNSGSQDAPIPTMTLVDDAGKQYTELADGTGVPNWLGVARSVAPAQTEQGNVAFDAPIAHYRLRLNDTLDEQGISIDIPFNFVHDMTSFTSPSEIPTN